MTIISARDASASENVFRSLTSSRAAVRGGAGKQSFNKLKLECKKRGLIQRGGKTELLARLGWKEEDAGTKAEGRPLEDKLEKMEVQVEEDDVPQVTNVAVKKSVPVNLPKEELKKLAGKKVKKGAEEYVILVPGVKTGLCGKYWSNNDTSIRKQRARKQPQEVLKKLKF